MRTITIVAAAMLLGACSGDKTDDTGSPSDTDADADVDADADADADADTDTDTAILDTADTAAVAEAVCARWQDVRAALVDGTWSGDVGSCSPGDVSSDGRDSSLALWNLYREMAGHGPITTDAGLDANAQDCALIQQANGYLTHTPASSATCYTSSGASAAGLSNIASTNVVDAIDLYMIDPGNSTTLGHRRWLLSNGLATVGIGGTSSYSCHTVIGAGGGGTSKEWTAWPPAGPVPEEVWTVSWDHLDDTGWSLQSDSLALGSGTVTVTGDDGSTLPMTVSSLISGYGSTHALSMIPDGWTVEAGRSYTVSVSGLSSPVDYTVDVVDCDAL